MKKYLVTGGSGTIGSAIVDKLIREGNKVLVIDTKAPIEQNNVDCILGDITNYEKFKLELNDKLKNEKISGVITVAGGALQEEWEDFENTDITVIEKSIDLNLMGHINAVHASLPFLERGSSITMISSINGMAAYRIAGYSAAKAGLLGFMYGIAKEMGQKGIRVNTISPGTVVTELTMKETKKDWEKLKEGTLTGHFVDPMDIADLVNTVINNNSINGQNLVIDSGQLIKK